MADLPDSDLIEDLTAEQREALGEHDYVTVGADVVWIEPEGEVRREPLAQVYYLRTRNGVFRVSRINGQVVEV